MSTLSSRQTEELNRSILDYLAASNLTTSLEALKQELDLVCVGLFLQHKAFAHVLIERL